MGAEGNLGQFFVLGDFWFYVHIHAPCRREGKTCNKPFATTIAIAQTTQKKYNRFQVQVNRQSDATQAISMVYGKTVIIWGVVGIYLRLVEGKCHASS